MEIEYKIALRFQRPCVQKGVYYLNQIVKTIYILKKINIDKPKIENNKLL